MSHTETQYRQCRAPSDWEPSIAMRDTVEETLDFFLRSVDIAERAS